MAPDTRRQAHSPLLNLPISKTITATTAQHSSKAPPTIITTTDPNSKNEGHEENELTTNVHGYIACSSVNNAIEINLRFPKCKCPVNGGNCNSKNINNKSKKVEPNGRSNETDDCVDVINSEEIKTKIINFDRNNLCNIVNNLDINTCTKCSISLDVKRLLTRIFSNPALNSDNLNGSCRSFLGDGASLLSASISPRLSESNMSATTDHDDFIIFNLNKQHQQKRNSADKRSTGTQHDESFDNKSPNNQSSKNKEVYVITDEFKKKCTEHHIIVKRNTANQKKKRPFSRSLENLSTPEVQRREFITTTSTKSAGQTKCDLDLTNGIPCNNVKRNGKICETKNRSKSVDDISTSSNEVLEGVDSVELIFISDEFLNKSNKEEPEVIIVDPSPRPTPSPNSQSGDEKLSNGKPSSRKSSQKSDKSPKDRKLYVISDDYKKRSLNNTVIVVKQREKKKTVSTKTEANPKNVDETLALNLKKTTATNSNTFLTYEEPFSPIYDLEDKEIP